ncbi:acyltransferase family protein [Erwinia rhapontici]|uniref:acyltransferase family protein n=1 Tax=Erwinia rhapontici TaxID=55212 RepID=UPI00133156F1|nr:acyltransferase [Erwinia rhapontici]MBP2155771.1 peptidoglycan/LPS O-acetylase OafA/YrhL [Erwinia rhapontici]
MIRSLQALRFYAAFAIVIYHACRQHGIETGSNFINKLFTHQLAFGVDIFFVISGYVIFSSYTNKPKGALYFIIDRIIRIAPMYWFTTIIFTAMLYINFDIYPLSDISFDGILKSLLFIPSKNLQGIYLPVHSVGWSLNMEVAFYALMSISIVLFSKRIEIPLIILVSLLYVISGSFDFMSFYHNGIVFEFLLGVLVAVITKSKLRKPTLSKKYLWIIVSLCVIAMMLLSDKYRFIYWGIPSFLIVLCLVYSEVEIKTSDLMMFLGASSYSLYLIHRIVISSMLWIFGNSGNAIVFIASSVLLSVAVAALTYLYVERPVGIWLKNRILISKERDGGLRQGGI